MDVFASDTQFVNEIKKTDTFLVTLLSHPNFRISVRAAKIAVNFQDSAVDGITLLNFLPNLIERMSTAKTKEQRCVSLSFFITFLNGNCFQLCKILIDYCGSKTTSEEGVLFIINYLISSTSIESPAFPVMLETVNAICSQFPKIYPIAITFAQEVISQQLEASQSENDVEMGEDSSYLPNFNPSLHIFSLLLAPNFARGTSALPLEDVVQIYGMKVNYALRYDIAVMAFRYGHWKEVALPLLESIQLGVSSTLYIYFFNG